MGGNASALSKIGLYVGSFVSAPAAYLLADHSVLRALVVPVALIRVLVGWRPLRTKSHSPAATFASDPRRPTAPRHHHQPPAPSPYLSSRRWKAPKEARLKISTLRAARTPTSRCATPYVPLGITASRWLRRQTAF